MSDQSDFKSVARETELNSRSAILDASGIVPDAAGVAIERPALTYAPRDDRPIVLTERAVKALGTSRAWAISIAVLLWLVAAMMLFITGLVVARARDWRDLVGFIVAVVFGLVPFATAAWFLSSFTFEVGRFLDGTDNFEEIFESLGSFWIVCTVAAVSWVLIAIVIRLLA